MYIPRILKSGVQLLTKPVPFWSPVRNASSGGRKSLTPSPNTSNQAHSRPCLPKEPNLCKLPSRINDFSNPSSCCTSSNPGDQRLPCRNPHLSPNPKKTPNSKLDQPWMTRPTTWTPHVSLLSCSCSQSRSSGHHLPPDPCEAPKFQSTQTPPDPCRPPNLSNQACGTCPPQSCHGTMAGGRRPNGGCLRTSDRPCPCLYSPPCDNREHLEMERRYRLLTLFVALPIVCIAMGVVLPMAEAEYKEPRPEYIPYSYMYIRTKKFPWGDGNHSFFHNPIKNAVPPDGYEEDDPYAIPVKE